MIHDLVYYLALLLLNWLLVVRVFTLNLNLLVVMLIKIQDWVRRWSSIPGDIIVAVVSIYSIAVIAHLVSSFVLQWDQAIAWELVF